MDALCNVEYLLLGFNRTRSCNQLEVRTSDFQCADFDNAVVRMKLAVYSLERLGYTLNRFNHFKPLQQFCVNLACVTNQTKNCTKLSFGNVDVKSSAFQPFD